MAPREVCDDHDVPLDDHGCWVCGHAGPIGEAAWGSWTRWCVDSDLGRMAQMIKDDRED